MLQHLRELSKTTPLVSYKDFIQTVLYTPDIGYYTRSHNPVGYTSQSDFYTAQSLKTKVFNQLALNACLTLLASDNYKDYSFIEIGSQPSNPLLDNKEYQFAKHKIITPSDSIEIPKKSIVFANELLDAQPFHRIVFNNGSWKELGVRLHPNGSTSEELLPTLSPEIETIVDKLPQQPTEGYQIDLPLAAESILQDIISQPWKGLLVLFDYGLSWNQLIHERPEGTGRAYYQHELSSDILANPGQQDITCHICWDRLTPILQNNGFQSPTLQSQEAFFIHHAQPIIEKILTDTAGQISPQKQSLKELLHPSLMGQKFQVLHAQRHL